MSERGQPTEEDNPLKWPRLKLLTLVALDFFCAEIHEGLTRNNFIEKIYCALEKKVAPIHIWYQRLCCSSRSKKFWALKSHPSKRLFYDYLEELRNSGHVEIDPSSHKIRPAPLGTGIAQATRALVEVDFSSYEDALKNLTWEIDITSAGRKLDQKFRKKMLITTARIQYEKNLLRNPEFVFVFANDNETFDKWFGKAEFTWMEEGAPIDSGILDIVFVIVKLLAPGGKEIELERSFAGVEEGAYVMRFTHPKLVELVGQPVAISYKVKIVQEKLGWNLAIIPHHPTRGFKASLNYGEADIAGVICMADFLGKKAVVERKQRGKRIVVSVDDTKVITPAQGVAFVPKRKS
jgi:hypothetical protein